MLDQNYYLYHLLFISFSLFVGYLVITDDRFQINRKIIFFLIYILLIVVSVYIEKMPYLIIKDLFWYSLVINGSFIFHVLILDRIFHWCWKSHYEYLGFVVSRISFTLSLSGILYLCQKLIQISVKIKIGNYYLPIIGYIYYYFIHLFSSIIINFSILFQNYSLLLMGKNINNFTIKGIIKGILVFTIFFSIAYLIGVPRLYIIWIFQVFFESYNYLKNYYKIDNFTINSLKMILHKFSISPNLIILFNTYYDSKYSQLTNIYEKPYHTFFMFDLSKFIKDSEINRNLDLTNHYNLEFPIKKIYKFYPWEELAKGYCSIHEEIYKLDPEVTWGERSPEERFIEAWEWLKLINRKEQLLIYLLPDLIHNNNELEGALFYIKELKNL